MIPLPKHHEVVPGAFELDDRTLIVHPNTPAVARELQRRIRERSGIRLRTTTQPGPGANIVLAFANATMGDESYRIHVDPHEARLTASTEVGLFYAVQSLAQRVESLSVPCLRVEDSPRFSWRGLMLDSARHFQRVSTIRWLLDQMALLKLNTLHWHLTDEQAWRLEIRRYPRLTQVTQERSADEPGGRGYYSHREVREIVRYAAERHIMVVPEIELPAHATAAMAAYPELTCTGEPVPVTGLGIHTFTESTGKRIFCASKPECLEFIEGVLEEVAGLFPSEILHIGGDERPDGIWSACPRCQETMRSEGLDGEPALQHWFMEKVNSIVRRLGRRSMAWTPTAAHGVPEGQIVQDWHFGVIPEALALGAQVVNSRDRFTYFDYPNHPGRQKFSWMPELPIEKVYKFEPVPEGTPWEQQHLILGAECSVWTELLEEEDLCAAIFPRLLAFAETVWSAPESRNLEHFSWRVQAMEPLLAKRGIQFAPREESPVLAFPARVETTIAADGPYLPECAMDGKFVRFFWSQAPPKQADTFTVHFDPPISCRGVRLYTGSDLARGDVLEAGHLEADFGQGFEKVCECRGAVACCGFPAQPVAALRIVVDEDMSHRLAIREIVPVLAG